MSIPEQRLFATVQDGKTILWDMDTLGKVWTIPAELFKFFPWEDSLWGWESGEESLWQIDLHTGSHGTYRLQDLAGANVRRWFLKELGCCDGTLCFSAEENGRYRLYQFRKYIIREYFRHGLTEKQKKTGAPLRSLKQIIKNETLNTNKLLKH